MTDTIGDFVLMFVILTDLSMLGSSRFASCIKLVAAQGMVLGLLPLVVASDGISVRLWVIAVLAFVLKGVCYPRLLFRSLRAADVRNEVEPLVDFVASVVLGVGVLVLSIWLASRVPDSLAAVSRLGLSVSLATILIGLQLIVSRRQALTQVIGYLVLENGVYVLGLELVGEQPFVVEVGVLLDVFVAVFVMGIAMFHISRELDHLDVHEMDKLRG